MTSLSDVFAEPSGNICWFCRLLCAFLFRLTWTWALWWARSESVPAPVGSSRARRSRPGSPLWCTGAWRKARRREGETQTEWLRRRDIAECGAESLTNCGSVARSNGTGGTGVWRKWHPMGARRSSSPRSLWLVPPLSCCAHERSHSPSRKNRNPREAARHSLCVLAACFLAFQKLDLMIKIGIF